MAAAVISAVLLLGHQLDRTVIIEGVEDTDTVQVLRRLGATTCRATTSADHNTPTLCTPSSPPSPHPTRLLARARPAQLRARQRAYPPRAAQQRPFGDRTRPGRGHE